MLGIPEQKSYNSLFSVGSVLFFYDELADDDLPFYGMVIKAPDEDGCIDILDASMALSYPDLMYRAVWRNYPITMFVDKPLYKVAQIDPKYGNMIESYIERPHHIRDQLCRSHELRGMYQKLNELVHISNAQDQLPTNMLTSDREVCFQLDDATMAEPYPEDFTALNF